MKETHVRHIREDEDVAETVREPQRARAPQALTEATPESDRVPPHMAELVTASGEEARADDDAARRDRVGVREPGRVGKDDEQQDDDTRRGEQHPVLERGRELAQEEADGPRDRDEHERRPEQPPRVGAHADDEQLGHRHAGRRRQRPGEGGLRHDLILTVPARSPGPRTRARARISGRERRHRRPRASPRRRDDRARRSAGRARRARSRRGARPRPSRPRVRQRASISPRTPATEASPFSRMRASTCSSRARDSRRGGGLRRPRARGRRKRRPSARGAPRPACAC